LGQPHGEAVVELLNTVMDNQVLSIAMRIEQEELASFPSDGQPERNHGQKEALVSKPSDLNV
jgi:hypothetical protein